MKKKLKNVNSLPNNLPYNFPWLFPTPIVESNFISVNAEKNSPWNVVTDPGRVPNFCFSSHHQKMLGFADLQLNPDYNTPGILGSGRSLFYRGHYLKGVGRTSLSGNWTGEDWFHNSGHLFPTAALREYLVSDYLKRVGLQSSILPCRDVLLRAMSATEQKQILAIAKKKKIDLAPIDRKFQAISVKKGNFCRWSNIHWAVAHLNEDNEESLFAAFSQFLPETKVRNKQSLEEEIVERIALSFHQGWNHFLQYLKLGLKWNSVHNNFTLDGRFLDLEVPLIFERPVLGLFEVFDKRKSLGRQLTFMEPVLYRHQFVGSLQFLIDAIDAKTRGGGFTSLRKLNVHLKKRIKSEPFWSQPAYFVESYVEELKLIFNFDRKTAQWLTLLIAGKAPRGGGGLGIHEVDFNLPSIELGRTAKIFEFDLELQQTLDAWKVLLARKFNDRILQVDSAETMPEIVQIFK